MVILFMGRETQLKIWMKVISICHGYQIVDAKIMQAMEIMPIMVTLVLTVLILIVVLLITVITETTMITLRMQIIGIMETLGIIRIAIDENLSN